MQQLDFEEAARNAELADTFAYCRKGWQEFCDDGYHFAHMVERSRDREVHHRIAELRALGVGA